MESSQCTNQRRFMTSPLVTNIQIFAWAENAKKVHILPNSVSFGSLTYGKTCVLSITGALAGWEHVLIGFQHIHNRELESRNKSKLPFILPGTRNLNICTLSSLDQVQGTNQNCLLFFPTEG